MPARGDEFSICKEQRLKEYVDQLDLHQAYSTSHCSNQCHQCKDCKNKSIKAGHSCMNSAFSMHDKTFSKTYGETNSIEFMFQNEETYQDEKRRKLEVEPASESMEDKLPSMKPGRKEPNKSNALLRQLQNNVLKGRLRKEFDSLNSYQYYQKTPESQWDSNRRLSDDNKDKEEITYVKEPLFTEDDKPALGNVSLMMSDVHSTVSASSVPTEDAETPEHNLTMQKSHSSSTVLSYFDTGYTIKDKFIKSDCEAPSSLPQWQVGKSSSCQDESLYKPQMDDSAFKYMTDIHETECDIDAKEKHEEESSEKITTPVSLGISELSSQIFDDSLSGCSLKSGLLPLPSYSCFLTMRDSFVCYGHFCQGPSLSVTDSFDCFSHSKMFIENNLNQLAVLGRNCIFQGNIMSSTLSNDKISELSILSQHGYEFGFDDAFLNNHHSPVSKNNLFRVSTADKCESKDIYMSYGSPSFPSGSPSFQSFDNASFDNAKEKESETVTEELWGRKEAMEGKCNEDSVDQQVSVSDGFGEDQIDHQEQSSGAKAGRNNQDKDFPPDDKQKSCLVEKPCGAQAEKNNEDEDVSSEDKPKSCLDKKSYGVQAEKDNQDEDVSSEDKPKSCLDKKSCGPQVEKDNEDEDVSSEDKPKSCLDKKSCGAQADKDNEDKVVSSEDKPKSRLDEKSCGAQAEKHSEDEDVSSEDKPKSHLDKKSCGAQVEKDNQDEDVSSEDKPKSRLDEKSCGAQAEKHNEDEDVSSEDKPKSHLDKKSYGVQAVKDNQDEGVSSEDKPKSCLDKNSCGAKVERNNQDEDVSSEGKQKSCQNKKHNQKFQIKDSKNKNTREHVNKQENGSFKRKQNGDSKCCRKMTYLMQHKDTEKRRGQRRESRQFKRHKYKKTLWKKCLRRDVPWKESSREKQQYQPKCPFGEFLLQPFRALPLDLSCEKARSHSGSRGGGGGGSVSGSGSGSGSANGAQRSRGRFSHSSGGRGRQGGATGRGRDDDDDDPGYDGPNSTNIHGGGCNREAVSVSGRNTSALPEPNLPPPILDDRTLILRKSVEKGRGGQQSTAVSTNAHHGIPSQLEGQPNQLVRAKSSDSVAEHATLSMSEMCDIIGSATFQSPCDTRNFHIMDKCLARLMHDLTMAGTDASDDTEINFDCHVCSTLALLIRHLSHLDHDGFALSCTQCAQIFNLMTQHAVICISDERPQTRQSRFDLCYKICKSSDWKIDRTNVALDRLKGKVRKYTAKVLDSASGAVPRDGSEDATGVMGERGEILFTEIPSTGISSTTSKPSGTSMSLNGNIVTNDQDQEHQEELPFSPVVPPVSPVHPAAPASAISRTMTVMPSISSSSTTGTTVTASHMALMRRPSKRKQPAIPPSIVEENPTPTLGHSVSAIALPGQTGSDAIEDLIYKKYGPKKDDPYETQRTYGERSRYVSLPTGNVHDVEQFMSLWNRPTGVPGIGEVVVGYPSLLRKLAMFWDRKREDCERTQYCPYQHREEGVILADQKENFSILRTRYQKHHQWERVAHLGNGMSGKCHLAIDLKTNFKFCCKKIHLLKYTAEELTLWLELHSPFIVRLFGAIRHGVKIYIFSEFIDGGSLAASIAEQKLLGRRLSHWSAVNYFQQLLKVLAYMQSKNILHEDVKADNILLRRNSVFLALTDFGTSRRLQDPKELKNKSPVGSQAHWSPEKASMEGHGYPSDLWAAVCVLIHMLSGEPPWVKRFQKKAAILNFIIYARPPPMEDVPNNVNAVVRDLIEKGLVKDPQFRPSPSELLRHAAFSILEQGSPENYFSTLMSQAHSIRPSNPSQEGNKDKQTSETGSNVLADVPVDATVLYNTEVSGEQIQESDSRAEGREASFQSPEANIGSAGESRESTAEGQHTRGNQLPEVLRTEAPETYPGQTDDNTGRQENISATSQALDRETNNVNSKVSELVEPLDIEKLLPHFNLIFSSDDSSSDQSIKSFFADSCNSTVELTRYDAQRAALQEYKPEERRDEPIPNLSIFDVTSSQVSKESELQVAPSAIEMPPRNDLMNQSLEYINHLVATDTVTEPIDPPLRDFKDSQKPSIINFHLSSGSDDCTSADLFDSGPDSERKTTKQSDKKETSPMEVETQNRRWSSGMLSPNGLILSPTSPNSSLNRKKPTNLKLDVSRHIPGSTIAQSQSESTLLTSTLEDRRSLSGSQLTPSTGNLQNSNSNTPSTGRLSSASRRERSNTSDSTAGSSASNPFKYASVKEEQERMMRELQEEYERVLSHSSGDSDRLAELLPEQPDDVMGEISPEIYVGEEDRVDALTTLQQTLSSSKLDGHVVKFHYNEKEFFSVRLLEWPVRWRDLIQIVQTKMNGLRCHHFTILNIDNSEVDLFRNVLADDFKVVEEEKEEEQCQCSNCKFIY